MDTVKTIERRVQETLQKLDVRSYENYLLSWDVKITFGATAPKVRKVLGEQFFMNDTELLTCYPDIDERLEKFVRRDDLFERVTESMWESWKDADTYSMCSPERLKAWGLPYGMKAPGVKGPFKAQYELRGRSSGHLVVTEFEGINLRVDPHFDGDLREFCFESNGSKTWLRRLGAMIEEWNDILQPVKVFDEYVYVSALIFNNELEDAEQRAEQRAA